MITTSNLTISQLKSIMLEVLLNKTDKISDVSDDSVVSAVAFMSAKVAQKAIKDIAIVEAQLFPESAVGSLLDRSARLFGVPARRGAIGSSTSVRIVAEESTQYVVGTHEFVNQNGILFELEENVTIGSQGFSYARVRSVDTGSKTNVSPNTILTVTPQPVGHIGCTNEYIATGGADEESDEVFRLRILNNMNILSQSTIEYFNQLFQSADDRVLRTLNLGVNESGNRVLAIVTQNGASLSDSELDSILQQTKDFFPISDLNRFGDTIGIELQNISYYDIGGDMGIDFRVGISTSADFDVVRQSIQIEMSKYLDPRFWGVGQKVEWDDLLKIVKGTANVRYVPDTYFNPIVDEVVPVNQLPRVNKFIMRDLDGSIIFDNNGAVTPVFYPNE